MTEGTVMFKSTIISICKSFAFFWVSFLTFVDVVAFPKSFTLLTEVNSFIFFAVFAVTQL